MYDFCNRLKHLRDIGDMNQSEFARKVGSTAATISRYENNLMSPTLDIALKIAVAFGVTLDWLAGNGNINEYDESIPIEYRELAKNLYDNKIPVDSVNKMVDILKGR